MADHPAPTPTPARRVSLPWRLTLRALRRLPQGMLSRGFGRLADLPLPRAVRPLVLGTFARLVGARLDEVERPLADFPSLNAFFVRRLATGIHSWPEDPRVLASPVDGVVGAVGTIESGVLLQAKGLSYTVAQLLAGDDAEAEAYEGGLFLTLYLSPRHYHRIHTPMPGAVVRARHVPGRLFPVNEPAVRSIPALFARNERLVCTLEAAPGLVGVVAVGAYNVGRISAAFDPAWSGREGGSLTNRPTPPPAERIYADPVPVATGDELMAFHLGSTVVLLTPPGMERVPGLRTGMEVRVGEPLARPGA